ncbi:hypothetical protein D9619_003568 [Psilocybe cf. subviscida]|uniref:NACHT domain-containing protein n=1 Tax=Psilocybe cf. subviscida TaxID=2480587 RepID=A0A8H5AWN2_9AGAR|nr:hypothetical protein D9619_003568 [Psilocybe cf. subviscida]
MPTDNLCTTSSAPTDRDLHMASPLRHRRSDGGPSSSIFHNATNTCIKKSSFIITNIQAQANSTSDPLNKLYDRVATNAILNAGGRADEVRCYPGTREKVIGLIERWMDSDNTTPNMMWLNGPAGAGKSAIVQTIAERCKERGVLAANFFFFRADPTRSTAQPLVATLLYQIVQASLIARQAITAVLSDNPLIFGASIQDQFNQLLSLPLHDTPQSLESPARRPIVLLIDGLDECDSKHKSSQAQIIQALDYLLVTNSPPFLVLVASRVEPQITMAFNQLASPVKSIFLGDQYAPTKDIRTFVTGEFNKIKKSHNLAHTLRESWPSTNDIDGIVTKSSGQFIFAATVMRFLSSSSASPMLSLERVQGIAPVAKNSPFSQLDAVYMYILSQADDQEAAKDLLAAKLLHNDLNDDERVWPPNPIRPPIKTILSIYHPTRYGLSLIESCASELAALLRFQGDELKFYHASLGDFLEDPSRSGEYHVDVDVFCAKILPAIWMKAPESQASALMGVELLIRLQNPTPDITKAFRTISPASTKDPDVFFDLSPDANLIFKSIHRLYYHDDVKSYRKILRQWIWWYVSSSEGRNPNDLPRLPYLVTYIWISKAEYWYDSTIRAALRGK